MIEIQPVLEKVKRLNAIKEYISLATLYIATDIAYDYGLLKLPSPLGDILYYGRYGGILIWYTVKFCRQRLGLLRARENKRIHI